MVPGLSDFQQKLVTEVAEAFARQLAGRLELQGLIIRCQIEPAMHSRHLLSFVN
jgi:hypothetical protein